MLVIFLFAIKLSSDIVNTVEISINYTKIILLSTLSFPLLLHGTGNVLPSVSPLKKR